MTEYSVPDSAEQVLLSPMPLVLKKTSSTGVGMAQSSLVLEKMSCSCIDDPTSLVLEKFFVSIESQTSP